MLLVKSLLCPGRPTCQLQVYALVDKSGNGSDVEVRTILSGLSDPSGVAWHRGSLFVAEQDRTTRYDNVDEAVLSGQVVFFLHNWCCAQNFALHLVDCCRDTAGLTKVLKRRKGRKRRKSFLPAKSMFWPSVHRHLLCWLLDSHIASAAGCRAVQSAWT